MADGIEVVVTPVEVNVEVADPDKVGEAGATPVSVVMEDNGNLDFLMSDGRHVIAETTSPIQLAVEAANAARDEAATSAASALETLTTTMRKITVNTDEDIPAFASLLSDYIIKVKSSARNGGFSTAYYFDFDNQSLSWIPTVGI